MTQLDSLIETRNPDSNEVTLHLVYTTKHLIRIEIAHLNIRVKLRHYYSSNEHRCRLVKRETINVNQMKVSRLLSPQTQLVSPHTINKPE